jgi:hypothetical protein
MTQDKLIEAIARAISTEDGIQAGEASDFAEWHWEDTVDHAKAALAAIEAAGFKLVRVTEHEKWIAASPLKQGEGE